MKIELENAVVYHGSNLDVLPTLPDNSVDSIVTDPPYELGFMGKSWDNSGIAYSVELWTECMRVLKPGGHLLAFGGSRTWHRLAVAIEDAGFEMRDSIAWLYGSGFPKSMDISKQIDKQAGAKREVVGNWKPTGKARLLGGKNANGIYQDYETATTIKESVDITVPSTVEAKQWQGWGTALKPAFEPVVVARKPLEEKTVAANVLKYGTGGLNIDGSRISSDGEHKRPFQPTNNDREVFGKQNGFQPTNADGRWPANIILDPYTAELLDEQSGVSTSLAHNRPHSTKWGFGVNADNAKEYDYGTGKSGYGDTGGASRFFYVAKASKKDRNEGLDKLEDTQALFASDSNLHLNGDGSPRNKEATTKNFHPTVKPTTLMEYLIKLVTPPNGTVLDPFTGSGSTGKAALLNGFKFIGIELTEEYLPIIEGRLKWASEQVSQKEEEKNEVLF